MDGGFLSFGKWFTCNSIIPIVVRVPVFAALFFFFFYGRFNIPGLALFSLFARLRALFNFFSLL